MDNYSRYILSWRIERVVSARFRLETIKDAITFAFGNTTPKKAVQFVTDGGPENVNATLKEFMNENSATIHQTIALKDIVQSNSLMEAYYRITKYSCLYLKKIKNLTDLIREFEHWIHEYHIEKPHYALGIHTPGEVLNGSNKHQKFSERMKQAAQDRRKFNKNVNCSKGY
jgi:transposase InsO family protein